MAWWPPGLRRPRRGQGALRGVAAALWLLLAPCAGDRDCPVKVDPHGRWDGSTRPGGTYTLTCHEGYRIEVGVNHTDLILKHQDIVCPEAGVWEEDPKCVNSDDCAHLVHACGVQGICVDGVDGYHCDCEAGVPLHQASDGTGEMLCGRIARQGRCSDSTCGAHGLCIDLAGTDAAFETGNHSYRCSCAEGFFDNNITCVPKDCGPLDDPYGKWEGETTYEAAYSLLCDHGSFVSGMLRMTTITCPVEGVWPEHVPVCVNAWDEAVDAEVGHFRFWFSVSCVVMCVVSAALAAGLTMGLVSLSDFDMKLLMSTRREDCVNDEQVAELDVEQRAAMKILPLLQDHHKLLVTLLLMNSIANEALPLFLDQIVPSWMAVLLSVTCVLFFGEILPSAVFTGPKQLRIAATLSPVVRCLQLLFMPVAVPIKLLLDKVVGHGEAGPKYTRAELRALLKLHRQDVVDVEAGLNHGSPGSMSGEEDSVASSEETFSSAGRAKSAAGQCRTFSRRTSLDWDLLDEAHARGRKTDQACSADEGLSRLGCCLAQRSVDLDMVVIGSLGLELQGIPEGSPPPGIQVLGSATVTKTLALLAGHAAGTRFAVKSEDGVRLLGTTSREELLWKAIMPQDISAAA